MAVSGIARASLRPAPGALVPALRRFGLRGWLVAAAGAVVSAALMGIPTAMFDNPWFTRMTPVRAQDDVFWLASAALLGLIAGTFAAGARGPAEGRAVAGGLLSYLAIGCPVCNKVVVLLLGVSGALTLFGSAQLLIGLLSLVLLGWTLLLRAGAVAGAACAVPGAC